MSDTNYNPAKPARSSSAFSVIRLLSCLGFRATVGFCGAVVRRKIALKILKGTSFYLELMDLVRGAMKSGWHFDSKDNYDLQISRDDYLGKPLKLYLRSHSSDLEVFHEVIIREQYAESLRMVVALAGVESCKTVFDLGANVGISAVYFQRSLPLAQIIAVEAEGSNYASLVKNLEQSGSVGVHPIHAAVWPRIERLKIDRQFGDGREWAYRCLPDSAELGAASVATVTIRELRERFKADQVDLLKIDIEGGEFELFADAKLTAETLEGVSVLVMELHGDSRANRQVIERIEERDYFTFAEGRQIVAIRNSLLRGAKPECGKIHSV